MAFESFYGGRQGVSFIIKKNYSSISEMLDEFQQGGATAYEVNYGEYVLINTAPDINDRTNGIIYRRGMDYTETRVTPVPSSDPENPDYNTDILQAYVEKPGCGAEYIGQIVGPEGSIKEIELGAYDAEASHKGNYQPGTENPGLVPGKSNKVIDYSWVNVKDNDGHITKYVIGFRFPYFMQEWETEAGSPYAQGLITDITPKSDEDLTPASQSDRPFYRKYKIIIPKGIKGDSVTDAGAIPTFINKGKFIYDVNPVTGEPTENSTRLEDDLIININDIVSFSPNRTWFSFKYEDTIKSAYLIDGRIQHEGIRVTNYDESSTGTNKQYDGGLFNYIEEVIKTDSSDLTHCPADHLLVYYSDPIRRSYLEHPVTYNNKGPYEDLGYVKGNPGTSPVMGNIDSLADLYQDEDMTNPKTPEQVGNSPDYRGWVVTIGDIQEQNKKYIWAYNYIHPTKPDWYCVGYFGDENGGGNAFVISSIEPEGLPEGGIWGYTEVIPSQGTEELPPL